MTHRRVQPEILDSLPAHHPDAIRSRRDLRLINFLMGNHRWIRRQLRTHLRPTDRILELGAGDGTLSRSLITHKLAQPEQILALDLQPAPPEWPPSATWLQQDLFATPLPHAEIVIANLFLHHFEAPQLAALSARLSPTTRLLLISEPHRHRLHILSGQLLHLLARLNPVTRHDMRLSIEAGFRQTELIDALHLKSWQTHITQTPLGAHRLIALEHFKKKCGC
jgi:2-polyprenyl-3-methyl-5-hydroxy-6-metoxy-1,4-benzoquinol methylase